MSLTEFEKRHAQQVLNDIYNSYASSIPYDLLTEPPETGITPNTFAQDRKNKILPLITMSEWTSERKERDSFLSEWVVLLGIKKNLNQLNLDVELAPPYLEIGFQGRKGVDLVASKKHPLGDKNHPVFAINVKLQKLKNNKRSESYKYDALLGCPAFELSLGNFYIETKKSGNVDYVSWLRKVATPNITKSGHIPDFSIWQSYLIEKMANTISHYMIKTDDFIYGDYKPSENETMIFPKTKDEFVRFYNNLSFSYNIFKKMCEINTTKI